MCTSTQPGGPISATCLKPAYLLENQSCSAPGPVEIWSNTRKSDLFFLQSAFISYFKCFDCQRKYIMLGKPEKCGWIWGNCVYLGINGLCQAGKSLCVLCVCETLIGGGRVVRAEQGGTEWEHNFTCFQKHEQNQTRKWWERRRSKKVKVVNTLGVVILFYNNCSRLVTNTGVNTITWTTLQHYVIQHNSSATTTAREWIRLLALTQRNSVNLQR